MKMSITQDSIFVFCKTVLRKEQKKKRILDFHRKKNMQWHSTLRLWMMELDCFWRSNFPIENSWRFLLQYFVTTFFFVTFIFIVKSTKIIPHFTVTIFFLCQRGLSRLEKTMQRYFPNLYCPYSNYYLFIKIIIIMRLLFCVITKSKNSFQMYFFMKFWTTVS